MEETGVALKHVAMYLDEEITDRVTSLQKDLKAEPHLPVREDEEGLGLESASRTKLLMLRTEGTR